MQQEQRDDGLLDLRPQHASGGDPEEIERIRTGCDLSHGEVERELEYLRLISGRKVVTPNDAYFASARQKIYQRVTIRKVTWRERLFATLIPESVRPLQAAIATAAIAVAITLSVVYYPIGNTFESHLTAEAYGPYVSISDMYSQHVEPEEQGQLTEQEMKEYREILLMSTAILGSPSSLSRSRSLAQSGK
ncbi:MAG: hypothetical protein IPH59_08295 [bacterium]|nr:hypothetical protein [bacterium]